MNTPEFSAQVQALIDAGVITLEQAVAAEAAAPVAGELTGVARCMNQQCEMFGVARPLRMRREEKRIKAEDMPIIISSTQYLTVIDDAELSCPDCEQPCAVQEHEPPKYPKMMAA